MTLPHPILELLDRLACPFCGGRLRAGEDAAICTGCDRTFPVRDGVLDFLAADDEPEGTA